MYIKNTDLGKYSYVVVYSFQLVGGTQTWLVVALINTLVNFVISNYASTPTYLKSHHYLVYVFNRWTWIRESMK